MNGGRGKLPPARARVRLRRTVERDSFVAEAGAKGIVIESSPTLIALWMDDFISGAEEWDNEVWWTSEDGEAPVDYSAPDEERVIAAFYADAEIIGNPRLLDGAAIAAVPSIEGRVDHRALGLLDSHSGFDRTAFAWVGSEHLGDGVFSASVYAGTAADSPYLWITDPIEVIAKTGARAESEREGKEQFLVCLFVGDADGEIEQPDPFLVCECGPENLAAESLRMLETARRLFQ
ncbi:MAG TPA: hypothetical protein VLK37_10970 [Solirubrobacterales bacterium]|nr:hypothetical protein [Solirubrobacterales bacterium]